LKFLSQRAVERRTRYHILTDSTDLPVNSNYVQQVLSKGNITLLSESKWLNQILIYCTDNNAIDSITALPFVKHTQSIGFKHEKIQPVKDKF